MRKIWFLLFFAIVYHVNAQQSEDFFDVKHLAEIKISFAEKNWMAILDSLKVNGDEQYITTVAIDGVKYENVGVGYKTNVAYKMGAARNPLVINLNYINSQQNHQGYTSFYLSVALRDPSMLREVLGYQILRNYMPASQANFAKLYVNNEYNGLYVNVEEIDDRFLVKHFGSYDGSFFKASSTQREVPGCRKEIYGALQYEENAACYLGNFKLLSRRGWDDLILLTKTLNQSPDKVEPIFHVDRILWMLAFNNAVANLSSYTGDRSHNYYLYKDKSGRFNPILADLNLAFGSFKNVGVGSDIKLSELQNMDPLLHVNNDQKPLISKLLKIPMYQKQYLAHLKTLVYNHFENEQYLTLAKELQTLITKAFLEDPNKSYNINDFQNSLTTTVGERSKIPGIQEIMERRSKFLKKHSSLQSIAPTVKEIRYLQREKYSTDKVTKFVIKAAIDGYVKRIYLYYRLSPDSEYTQIFMADDGKLADEQPGDKVYTAIIDPKGNEAMEYYIMTESSQAVNFEPYNYMYYPKKITLKELN